jgi:hypothetical protein
MNFVIILVCITLVCLCLCSKVHIFEFILTVQLDHGWYEFLAVSAHAKGST